MPGPLEDGLSRFTPSLGNLDRDAILFAAGRASARPGRKWSAVAALLALSQALTLALLVTTPTPPRPEPSAPTVPSIPSESVILRPEAVRDWQTAFDEAPYSPPAMDDLIPDEPPLHVSSRWDPFAQ